MRRLPRPVYIAARLAEALVSAFSRFMNAALLGGSTAQSVSARAYIDGMTDPVWARRRRIINSLFFWQEDHTRSAWESEVANARRTLARLGSP